MTRHLRRPTRTTLLAALFILTFPFCSASSPGLYAQTPAPSPASPAAPAKDEAPVPATPAAPTWSLGPIDFSGLIDGYYSFNANHPPTKADGNQLRNFDYDADSFSLNMAKLTMSHDPDPLGFRVDLGFGKAFTKILSGDPSFRYVEQAFVSWKPARAKGFEADFGEFVTSAGAEVIESKDNWNYSRSLLFALAIPYYHVGLRTSMPITKTFTGGVQVVNGWNNISDNNSGKTIGLTGVLARPRYTLSGNYYVGPENAGTNKGFRNLIDATLLLTPSPRLNAYINYDYAQNRSVLQNKDLSYTVAGLDRWQGIAGALHYQATSFISITPRFEYYKDQTGFTTGTAQTLNEFTLTAEYKFVQGVLARAEFRRDHSDQRFFVKGNGLTDSQSTLEFGVVGFFGPKR